MLDSAAFDALGLVASGTLQLGRIKVDLHAFTVYADARPVPLTRLEFDLLVYLMRNAGRTVFNEELMHNVVQSVYRKDSSVIRVHVAHLRKKLGPTAELIVTIRSRGLIFRKPGQAS